MTLNGAVLEVTSHDADEYLTRNKMMFEEGEAQHSDLDVSSRFETLDDNLDDEEHGTKQIKDEEVKSGANMDFTQNFVKLTEGSKQEATAIIMLGYDMKKSSSWIRLSTGPYGSVE